ncbi:MAG: cell division protein FtsZ [Chitinophagaceae bacterium]|nr:MAG: cell division protein FtsZ [Chitinophagaceae bacterium]
MEFNLPKDQSSIIKVIGVGGGGCNAVNYMYNQGIQGVNFVICNTDAQSLEDSPIPNQIQLGPELTEGLGAGSRPEVGRKAAEESIREIKDILEKKTKMVFITTGLGGGTGTGAAPVIAQTAKDMGILTVSIVTTPFKFEGKRKLEQAMEGLEELKRNSDAHIIISNERLKEIYNKMTRSEAFSQADNILAIAAKSISEIITIKGNINVDFADVEYVMRDSGLAIMGSAIAEGENRAIEAVEKALSSPLLSENNIKGAKNILLNITTGSQQEKLEEIDQITEYIEKLTGSSDFIMGLCTDENMGDQLSVTVIATGFAENRNVKTKKPVENEKVILDLEDEDENQNENRYSPKKRTKSEADESQIKLDLDIENDAHDFSTSDDDENDFNERNMFGDDDENESESDDLFKVKEVENTEKTEEEESPEPEHSEAKPEERYSGLSGISERKSKLKSLSMKLMSNEAKVEDYETEPAFKRKKMNFDDESYKSSQNDYSKFSIDQDDDENGPSLDKRNSFLHDNID